MRNGARSRLRYRDRRPLPKRVVFRPSKCTRTKPLPLQAIDMRTPSSARRARTPQGLGNCFEQVAHFALAYVGGCRAEMQADNSCSGIFRLRELDAGDYAHGFSQSEVKNPTY